MIIYAIFREPPTNHPPPPWSDDMSKFPVPSAAPSKRHTGEVLRRILFIGTLVRWRKVLLDSAVDPTWHEQPRKHLVQNVGNSWWSAMKNESLEGNTNFLAKSAQWNPDVNQFLRQKIVSLCFFQESDNLNINENGFVSFQPPHTIRRRTRCSKFPFLRTFFVTDSNLQQQSRSHRNLHNCCRIIDVCQFTRIFTRVSVWFCLWCLDAKIPHLMLLRWAADTTADLTLVVDTVNSRPSHSQHSMEGIYTTRPTLINPYGSLTCTGDSLRPVLELARKYSNEHHRTQRTFFHPFPAICFS